MFTTRNKEGRIMVTVINKEKLKEDIARAGFTLTSLAKNIKCSKAHI